MWESCLKSGRREVAAFANMPFDSFLRDMARSEAKGKPLNLVGVLCGAFACHAMASKVEDAREETCPWLRLLLITFAGNVAALKGEKPPKSSSGSNFGVG